MSDIATLNAALNAQLDNDLRITFIDGVHTETVLTLTQLQQRSLQLLHSLQARGLRAGDELIFFLHNNREFIEFFWACMFGSIIPVPIAVGISDEHRAKLLRIFQRLQKPYVLADSKSAALLQTHAASDAENNYQTIIDRLLVVDDIVTSGELGQEHTPNAEDLAFIQFSSGSTREPKGVCLTHANLIATLIDIGQRAQYTKADSSLSWMPLTHDMGLIGFHLNMIVFGMHQHIMATDLFSRRPLLWLQKVSEKRATILSSPNFGYKHYLKMHNARDDHDLDLACVRILMNGAEPISVKLCEQFLQTMAPYGLKREVMHTVYGLAEASLGVSMAQPGNAFECVSLHRDHLTLGEPVDHVAETDPRAVLFAIEGPPLERCRVRIAYPPENVLPENTIGEIQLAGPNVTAGYYRAEEENRELFTTDGWLRTGDLGILHRRAVVITGRLKDIIFVNGQNYYPHDIEGVLLTYGQTNQQLPDILRAVFDLGKIVVCGVRGNDADQDQVLVCVLYRADLADFLPLIKYIKATVNEHIGIEVDHVLPVRRIPKTTSGKIQRRFFAEQYQQGDFVELIEQINQLSSAEQNEFADYATSEHVREMVDIFRAALPDKTIAPTDNFFEIGLSSLELSQIHEKIDERYPGVVDIVDLFDHPTIDAVAKRVSEDAQ